MFTTHHPAPFLSAEGKDDKDNALVIWAQDVNQHLKNVDTDQEGLQLKVKSLETMLQALISEQKGYQQAQQSYQKQLATLRGQIAAVNADNKETLATQLRILEAEILHLKAPGVSTELANQLQFLKTSFGQSTKASSVIRSQLQGVIAESGRQAEQFATWQQELAQQIEQQAKKCESELADLQVQLSQTKTALGKRIAVLEGQIRMLEADGSQLKTQVGMLETKESKLNIRMGGVETKVDSLQQRFEAFSTKADSKDEKEKPLDVNELERLAPELTKVLKTHYGSRGTVPGLLSDRPQPIADINLTITEQKRETKQHLALDAKRKQPIGPDKGDEKKGAAPESKEKTLDQEMLDYYESEHSVQTPIAIEAIFDKRATSESHDSSSSFSEDKEGKQSDRSKPTVEGKAPKRLLILGRPGVGKTTMSQYMAYRWAKGKDLISSYSHPAKGDEKGEQKSLLLTSESSLLPESKKTLWSDRFDFVFWIPLRHLSRYEKSIDVSLAEIIYEECCVGQTKNPSSLTKISKSDQRKQSVQVINYILTQKKERCLVLLDGGDEVAHQVAGSTPSSIKKLLQQAFDAEHVVLTSRPYQLSELTLLNPKGFDRELENMGFTDAQIEHYIQTYFGLDDKAKTLAEGLLKFLKNNLRIWGTAHIPIHIVLICSVWEELGHTQTFNEQMNVTDLYCEITHHLLKHVLVRKGVDIRNRGEAWLYQQCAKEMRFLERLALMGLQAGKVNLDKTLQRQVLDMVESDDMTDLNKFAERPLIVTALEIGLLKSTNIEDKEELDKEHYFIHLTFQEFLAARYLVSCLNSSNPERVEEARQFIEHYKYTSRYQVLLGFVSGLVSRDKSSSVSLIHFWNILLAQPLDLTGIGHWCVVLRCLEEANCDKRIPHLETLLKSFERFVNQQIHVRRINKKTEYLFSLLAHHPLVLERTRIIDVCVESLEDKNRIFIIRVLTMLGEKRMTGPLAQTLLTALRDSAQNVRHETFFALRSLSQKKAVDFDFVIQALLKTLSDSEPNLRCDAIFALQKLGEKASIDSVIQALLKALEDIEWEVRYRAAFALGELGKKASIDSVIQALLKALGDSDFFVRGAAASALGELGEKASIDSVIQALLKALEDSDNYVRSAVASALGKFGGKALIDSVIQALLKALEDSDSDVRRKAASALGELGEKASIDSVIQALLKALEDSDNYVRSAATFALGELGEKASIDSVIQALLKALEDSNSYVRSAAASALGKFGAKAAIDSVIQSLLKALRDNKKFVRSSAAFALGKLGEKTAIHSVTQTFLKALGDNNKQVRQGAASALGELDEKSAIDSVIQTLLKALGGSNKHVRQGAVLALGKLGEKATIDSVIQALLKALRDDYAYVRQAAVSTLGKLGEKAAIKPVIQALIKILKNNDNVRLSDDAEEVLRQHSQFKPELVISVALEEIGWLWYDSIIKYFLNTTSFPLPVLLQIYLTKPHDLLPELIAQNALRQRVPITVIKDGVILHEGAEPIFFSMTPKQSKQLVKGFLPVLKNYDLPDAIPQAYLSEKSVFLPVPVPRILPSSNVRTIQELKDAKASATFAAVSHTVAAPNGASAASHVTLTLEQFSALMRQQQVQSGLIASPVSSGRASDSVVVSKAFQPAHGE